MEAMVEWKKAGKLRYIGFTGHKDPLVHFRMLDIARDHQFHFDAVQMPLNVMDAQLPQLRSKRAAGPQSRRHRPARHEVFRLISDISLEQNSRAHRVLRAVIYVAPLNLPTAVQITGIDSQEVLDQAFEAVRTFKPMSSTQVASLLERTRTAALTGKYEPFKTSPRNDGTAHNPQWLG